jgi:hypothetical protein
VILAVLAGCAPAGRTTPAAMRIDRDELAVWATLVDSVFAADGAPFVVVADSSWHAILTVDDVREMARILDPGFPQSAVDDFQARNRTHVTMPRSLPAGTPVRWLRIETFAPDGDMRAANARFHREHALVVSRHYFSRPGFDAARRRAVVTTSSVREAYSSGQLFLLVRGAHGWRVVARQATWET